MNIAVVFYSAVRSDLKEPADYFKGDKPYVKGSITNEAPLYSIAKELDEKDEQRLDAIYGFASSDVASDEAFSISVRGERRSYENQKKFFEQYMKETCKELSDTEFHFIDFCYPTDDLPAECYRRVVEAAKRIKYDVKEKGCELSDCRLFLDVTGGIRVTEMMLLQIIQLLTHDGMKLEKIVYSDFQGRSSEPNRLFDMTALTKLSKLTAGADAFVKYGSSMALEEYFHYGNSNAIHSDSLKKLLDAMHTYSDVMQICQVNELRGVLIELKHAIEAFSTYLDKGTPTNEESAFGLLLGRIEQDYADILQYAEGEDATLYYQMVKWCIERGFTQQAMTICVEWMPTYLMANHLCIPVDMDMMEPILTDDLHPNWQKNLLQLCTAAQYHRDCQRYWLKEATLLAKEIASGNAEALDLELRPELQDEKELFRFLLDHEAELAGAKKSQEVASILDRLRQCVANETKKHEYLEQKFTRKTLFESISRIKEKSRPLFYAKAINWERKSLGQQAKTREERERDFAALLDDRHIVETTFPHADVSRIASAYWEITRVRNIINHAGMTNRQHAKTRDDVDAMIRELIADIDALGLGKQGE